MTQASKVVAFSFSFSLFVFSKKTSKFANKLRRMGNMVLRKSRQKRSPGRLLKFFFTPAVVSN